MVNLGFLLIHNKIYYNLCQKMVVITKKNIKNYTIILVKTHVSKCNYLFCNILLGTELINV